MRLDGKVAIVTGAASGMGRAIAKLYASEGAKVVVADLNIVGAEEVVEEITAEQGVAKALEVNVADGEAINRMVNTAVEEFGQLDILVNNAGIMDGFEPVGEVQDERWDLIFDINTKSVMRSMRKAIPLFLEQGHGVIVNIASTGGYNGGHAGAPYVASKHAVVGLTKNTGYMYAQAGIRCNAIAPGAVKTNISASMKNVSEFGMERTKPVQGVIPNIAEPEQIAQAALFLATDDASFVNGEVLTVDGGWTAAF